MIDDNVNVKPEALNRLIDYQLQVQYIPGTSTVLVLIDSLCCAL